MQQESNILLSELQRFFRSEASGGLLLILAAAMALAVANSSFALSYEHFLSYPLFLHNHDNLMGVRDWINDGLMSLFFLSVGMEIKREITGGEISTRKKASLPVIAAIGGMLLPAAIYLIANGNTPSSRGWGIPMATDIAFSLGVLALLGKRIPVSLRIFVASLAIADDLGAVLVIAIFYASDIQILPLLISACIVISLYLLGKTTKIPFMLSLLGGGILWYCLLRSGVHPTISGVLLGFLLPVSGHQKFRAVLGNIVSYGVMPLFAFANAGVVLSASRFSVVVVSPVPIGIFIGLLVGKTTGIFSFSFLSSKLGLSSLPEGVSWSHIFGASILCGIGFTMSLFIAQLAFASDPESYMLAKLAILEASVCAGILGFLFLRFVKAKGTDSRSLTK